MIWILAKSAVFPHNCIERETLEVGHCLVESRFLAKKNAQLSRLPFAAFSLAEPLSVCRALSPAFTPQFSCSPLQLLFHPHAPT
jgi:hypothetical protein